MPYRESCGFVCAAFLCLSGAVASAAELEPIVVKKKGAVSRYAFDAESAASLPASSLTGVLSFLPVDLAARSPLGGVQSDFSIRASSFEGVAILLDGHRLNDPQTGHHSLDLPLTMEDIERIEAVPGAPSSFFGPGTTGGAIKFVSKKPQGRSAVIESGIGSYGTVSELFSVTQSAGNLGVRFSTEGVRSRGFTEDTDSRKFTSTLYSSLDIPGCGAYDLNFGYQDKEFGAHDFYTPASGYLSREWTETLLLQTGLQLEKEGFSIKPDFFWRRHFDKFMLDKTQARSRYLNHHRTDTCAQRIYLAKDAGARGKAGLGAEYGEELLASTNLGKAARSHKGLFVDAGKEFGERFAVKASLRGDEYEGVGTEYTWALALRRHFSAASALVIGASRNIRIPTFTELYYNDPTTAGDEGLRAEASFNYEAGYEYAAAGTEAGLTFFFRQEEGVIDWVKASPSQAKWRASNIGDAMALGAESYAKLKLGSMFSLDGTYSYTRRRPEQGGYAYKYGFNYGGHLVSVALARKGARSLQGAGVRYEKKPGRDGWLLFSLRLEYVLNKQARLFVVAENALNSEYQEIEGIAEPGRFVESGLRLEW